VTTSGAKAPSRETVYRSAKALRHPKAPPKSVRRNLLPLGATQKTDEFRMTNVKVWEALALFRGGVFR